MQGVSRTSACPWLFPCIGNEPQAAKTAVCATPRAVKEWKKRRFGKIKARVIQKHENLGLLVALLVLTLWTPGRVKAQVRAGPPKLSGASSPAYPLKVSASGRYLVDQNNIPFLIAGDSPHTIPVMISTTAARRYFDDRQEHGFNTVWINVLCAAPYFPYCRGDGSTYDGIRPFTGYVSGGSDTAHYDLNKRNEAYFARVDQMLRLAANHGMAVFLDPIDTGQWVPTLRNNGPAAARAYGEYVGNRYKHFPNIVWLNGDDFRTWQDPGDDAVVRAVAKGIKSVDPNQIQTIELDPPWGSSFDDRTWVPIASINSTYVYGPTYIQMLHSYNQRPIAPTYLVEAHYDLERVGRPSDYGTPMVLRREEYWTLLSGGKGQIYGNAFIWSFMGGWQFNLDTVGVAQLMIWHQFFSSLPWQNLVPDQAHRVVTSGLGSYGNLQRRVSQSYYCTAARTSGGSVVVAYMPTARTITVDMASLKGRASAQWFDPTNGTYTTIPGGPFANRGTRLFKPPGNNSEGDSDWVLLLKASDSI
jgi:hypothetical protein